MRTIFDRIQDEEDAYQMPFLNESETRQTKCGIFLLNRVSSCVQLSSLHATITLLLIAWLSHSLIMGHSLTHMNPPKWLFFYIQFLILLSSWCNQIKTQMQTIHFHLFAWIRLTHAPNELLSSIITIRDAWYTHSTQYLLLNLLSCCLRIGSLQYQNTNGKNNNWNYYWVNHLSVKKTSNYFHTWAGRDFDEALHVWWCRCDWWIRWEIQRKPVNSLASTSTELRCNVKKIEEKPQKYYIYMDWSWFQFYSLIYLYRAHK